MVIVIPKGVGKMDKILYVKINQNIPIKDRTIYFRDIATLYCTDKDLVKQIEQSVFYTLPKDAKQKTMFAITKVYERLHAIAPALVIENVGERDFIVDYEGADHREKSRVREYTKTVLVSFILFFGAAFTVMTFNEDVSVADVFDKIYLLVMGREKEGGSILEACYAVGLPVGILLFYNHFRRRKRLTDPTPIQVEMHTYDEQVNKALIAEASREGHTIDSH